MFLDSYFCVMCIENVEDDFWHLFFRCPFSDACLTYLGIQWDSSLDFQLMVLDARQRFGLATFREIFILGVIGMTLSLMLDLSLFPSGERILLGR
jgi:hypothetical protein